uniref:Transmembrane protein 200B n=1 Tax=Geotrypetes seraphini TaxID=260995 RepID=A0A6P8S389_GEOSA|nr:transmembrane protein 200B [Geotrypetes seraphini]
MTVRSPRLDEIMKNHETPKSNQMKPSACSVWHICKSRRQTATEVAIKGKLRMKSPSGAFVILGVFVVFVGMTVAVIGYWPRRDLLAAFNDQAGNSSGTKDIKNEVKAAAVALPRNPPNNDRLKLIGPVIMGVGLFIFICANTMLYENRDMETRLLIQKSLYSMATGLPSSTNEEDKYCQKSIALDVTAGPEEGVYDTDLSPGSLQTFLSPGKRWTESCVPNKLQTTALLLHQNGISPSVSFWSLQSDSCNLVETTRCLFFTHAESMVTSTMNTLMLPIIKLNNCIIESADVSQLASDEEVERPKESGEILSHSWNCIPKMDYSSRGQGLGGSHVVLNMGAKPQTSPQIKEHLSLESARKPFNSEIHLNIAGHCKSVELSRRGTKPVLSTEERKNRSWPRLDHIGLIGYTKLENTEDSDKLLNQFTLQNINGERTKQLSRDMG